MYDKAYITFVNTQSEGNGGADDLHFSFSPLYMKPFLRRIPNFRMVHSRFYLAVCDVSQVVGNLLSLFPRQAIYNASVILVVLKYVVCNSLDSIGFGGRL